MIRYLPLYVPQGAAAPPTGRVMGSLAGEPGGLAGKGGGLAGKGGGIAGKPDK